MIVAGKLQAELRTRETPQETKARLEREAEDARHARWRHTVAHLFALAGLTVTGGVCLWVAVQPGDPEEKKWATAAVSAIVTGSLSFLAGQAVGRKG